ncbi:hypothetical protein OSB04_008862 [Centaurea solstitialis]|uniref:TF-B3 domain-containing protein n=1 Tax=Centaurea solstitialis TaxID=347529 RepID=A0AA38WJV3_9ASTR|nr:hypothetical protein OSB04_008862 [Centaurea solstitialis]
MNSNNGNGVSFFKILLKDDVDYLPLPPNFAKKHLKNKNQLTLVLKTKSSVKWKVKCVEIEDRYYFMDGWLKFAKDNGLKKGDFVVFWLNSPSIFQVFLYAPNGCLKTSGGGKKRKILEKPSVKKETSDDDSMEDVKQSRGGKKLKIWKKPSVKKEMSDDDSMEDVKRPLRRNMTKTAIHSLSITKSFMKDVGIYEYCSLRLKNDHGYVWKVKVMKYRAEKMPYLTKGWSDFRKDNKIQTGDWCEFHHVRANLLLVRIFKKGKQVLKKS